MRSERSRAFREKVLVGRKKKLIPKSWEASWIGLVCSLLGEDSDIEVQLRLRSGGTLGPRIRASLREDCTKFCVAALCGLCDSSTPRRLGDRNPRERLLKFPLRSLELPAFNSWCWQCGNCRRGCCKYYCDPENRGSKEAQSVGSWFREEPEESPTCECPDGCMVVHFHIRPKSAPPSPPSYPAYPGSYSNPGTAARSAAVARAAQVCVEAALEAAELAREAAASAADAAVTLVATGPLNYPPEPNVKGERFFFARSHPHLEHGIYSAVALLNRGVDPDEPAPSGVLEGYKTEQPCFRKSYLSGVNRGAIFWR